MRTTQDTGIVDWIKCKLKDLNHRFKYMTFWNCGNDEHDWGENSGGRCSGWRGTLCSVALAAGAANTLRLPREAAQGGAAPFLTALSLLTAVAALPLVYLKLGLSTFSEQGAIKIWRAVPFLKGLGYVKLLAAFFVAVYYMIYVSLSCALLIWTAKGPVPLVECTELHRDLDGYHLNGTSGQKCINKTFLKPVFEEPIWYGIIAAVMFTFWLLIPLCLIKIPQSFQKSLYFFGGGTLVLCVAAATLGERGDIGQLWSEADWEVMLTLRFWYSTFVQLMFSTHIGFGYITTAASTFYSKSNVLWSAVFLVVFNLVFGWFSVLLWHGIGGPIRSCEPSVIMVLVLIYDSSVAKDVKSPLPSISYALVMFSGITSALMLLYPIISCLNTEGRCKKTTLGGFVVIFGGFMSLLIFIFGLDIITLLDDDVIPMYLTVSLFLELLGLLFLYGFKSIKQDIEFISKSKITYLWFGLWGLIPIGLLLLIMARIAVYVREWTHKNWSFWLIIGMYTLAGMNILVWATWVTWHKEGYGIIQKLISAIKPSRKWGPVDPIVRNRWLQYKLTRKKPNLQKSNVTKACHHYETARNQRSLLRTDYNHHAQVINFPQEKLPRPKKYCKNIPENNIQVPYPTNAHCIYLCEVNYGSGKCWINNTE